MTGPWSSATTVKPSTPKCRSRKARFPMDANAAWKSGSPTQTSRGASTVKSLLPMSCVHTSTSTSPFPKLPSKLVTSWVPVNRLVTRIGVPCGKAKLALTVHSEEPMTTTSCREAGAKKKAGMLLPMMPDCWKRTRLDLKALSTAKPFTSTSNTTWNVSAIFSPAPPSMTGSMVPWTTGM